LCTIVYSTVEREKKKSGSFLGQSAVVVVQRGNEQLTEGEYM
jgi:hypothetical protein